MSQANAVSQADARPGVGQTLGVPGGLSLLVTRAPDEYGVLMCDDDVLTPQRPPACSAALAGSGAIRPGTGFNDPVSGLEVVCTRAGHGTLTFAGRPLKRGLGPRALPTARRKETAA